MDDVPPDGAEVATVRCWTLVLCLLLAGCGALQTPAAPTSTPRVVDDLPTAGGESPTPQPTLTPTEYQGVCSFVWASQALPDVTAALGQALRSSGMTEVEGGASAYGETCVDVSTNAIVRFSPQQTDFSFNVAMRDANDTQAQGQWLVLLLDVLKEFPPGKVPGLNPGRVQVTFLDGSRSVLLDFALERAQKLRAQGLTGAALFEALLRPE